MESVAHSAGVSTKTLYRLIPNKAALFEAIITDGIDRFVSRLRLRACEGGDIEAALREALSAHCRAALAGYKVPKSIEFRSDMPRTETGKLQKRLLREAYWVGQERRI